MDELYKNTVKTVYGFMYSLCGNAELAKDLTQDVYLQALRSIDRYNGKCKISVWLCQIGKHLWYQYLSKNNREIPYGDDLFTMQENADKAPSPLIQAELADDVANLSKLISLLGEDARDVMWLRIAGDYSFKEIGYILSRSENWARVTFYRSKEKIISMWEERYGK